MKTVLILGSAPDAIRAQQFDFKKVNALVVLNNAWQIRPDWTHAIYPEDFPSERRPSPTSDQEIITHKDYVPANNSYGGIIYAGATMALTAAYWVLDHFKPNTLLFCGSDMIYDQPGGNSHFYGRGDADPLRDDPTLQSLEAKSNRLMLLAARGGCLTANLSDLPTSRLTFPRVEADTLGELCEDHQRRTLLEINASVDQTKMDQALNEETDAQQYWETGDYWNADFPVDRAKLGQIDNLWKKTILNQNEKVIS